ncbi:MAG: response regulator, partial [Gammaproteobacteria bacterium]
MTEIDSHNEKPVLLLVDDDEIYCEVLGDALRKRDYAVSVAHNLADALQLARDKEPEYAVVDLRIGTESGLELVKQL